ncbi:hypothetical protein ABH931_004106 [Streptacidiphilus sp. MAP12-33]
MKDFAYQGTTTDFWGSMEAVGGPQTYLLGCTRWADPARDEDPGELADLTRATLDQLRTAVADLGPLSVNRASRMSNRAFDGPLPTSSDACELR